MNTVKKESFFATCDRDEQGHCKVGTGNKAGSAPQAGIPKSRLPTKVPRKVQEQKPSEKALRAMKAHHMVDKTIQRYAEEHNEPRFAKRMGGVSFPDSEAVDVAISGKSGAVAHGIELKTMVSNKNNKITMKKSAMIRKLMWERKNKATFHTVVMDDHQVFNAKGDGQHDESKRRYFYKRGCGSFRVNNMHECKNLKELKQLMDAKDHKLPDKARRTDDKMRKELFG